MILKRFGKSFKYHLERLGNQKSKNQNSLFQILHSNNKECRGANSKELMQRCLPTTWHYCANAGKGMAHGLQTL